MICVSGLFVAVARLPFNFCHTSVKHMDSCCMSEPAWQVNIMGHLEDA